ncbi:hypothetical protein LINPERPRIM_LOCUS11201 [Linum perenne]
MSISTAALAARIYVAKPFHFPFLIPPLPHASHTSLYTSRFSSSLSPSPTKPNFLDSNPLLKDRTPVHRFTSLQPLVRLLYLALLVLSDSTSFLPLPPNLFFALTSLTYSISSSVQTSDLQAKCASVSAQISALTSLICLILARFVSADLTVPIIP